MKPWFLCGTVIHGFGRGGTQLGYPTANLELNSEAIRFLKPYSNLVLWGWGCVEAAVAERSEKEEEAGSPTAASMGPFPFVMSVGHNPQFRNVDLSAEVYFLHTFGGDFYGRVVRIITLGSIRSQSAFTTLEELIRAIDGDVAFAKEHLAMPTWAAYAQHAMVDPTRTVKELRASPELPYFGIVDAQATGDE